MTSQRTRMRMVERLRDQGVKDELVLAAMSEIPRHMFVDEALASRAYDDVSLPIGFGQTISNPFTVARMVELARNGTHAWQGARNRDWLRIPGCGAVARGARRLFDRAPGGRCCPKRGCRLRELGVRNVKLKHGDGHAGLPGGWSVRCDRHRGRGHAPSGTAGRTACRRREAGAAAGNAGTAAGR